MSADVVNSMYEIIKFIGRGELKHAIFEMGTVVERSLREFYRENKDEFDQDTRGRIAEYLLKQKGSRDIDRLPLGILMGLFSEGRICEFIEERKNTSLEQTRALVEDRDFVNIRNDCTHELPQPRYHGELNEAVAEHYLFKIQAMLQELGYKDCGSGNDTQFTAYYKSLHRRICARAQEHSQASRKKIIRDIIPNMYRYDYERQVREHLAVEDIIGKAGSHFLICGEGGAGKSTIIHYFYEKVSQAGMFQKGRFDYLPIPVLVYLNRIINVKRSGDRQGTGDYISSYIRDVYGVNLDERLKLLDIYYKEHVEAAKEAFCEAEPKRPFFLLLLDGYNELRLSGDEKIRLNSELETLAAKNVQIIMTTRARYIPAGIEGIFTRLTLEGLDYTAISRYLTSGEVQLDDHQVREIARDRKTLELLKNPMTLTLYGEGEKLRKKYGEDIKNKRLVIKDPKSAGEIFWNYIELSIIREKIYLANVKQQEKEERYLLVKHILPIIAWEMVSTGVYELHEDVIKEKITSCYRSLDRQVKDFQINRNLDYLTNDICLLTRPEQLDPRYSRYIYFQHQNYRDFFAAVYIAVVDREDNLEPSTLESRLEQTLLPFDIRRFLGEILGEHYLGMEATGRQSTLCRILEKGNISGYGVLNISEIHKSLGVLELHHYTAVDFAQINFFDIEKRKILVFIRGITDKATAGQLLKEVMAKKSHQPVGEYGNLKLLGRAIKVSLLTMSNSDLDTIVEFYQIWSGWLRDVYRHAVDIIPLLASHYLTMRKKKDATAIPETIDLIGSKGNEQGVFNRLFRRTIQAMLKRKKLAVFLAGFILQPYARTTVEALRKTASLGMGTKDFLQIFDEIYRMKRGLAEITGLLDKPQLGSPSPELLNTIYDIAQTNSYTSNYVIFVINYYLLSNLQEAFRLIQMLYEKSKEDKTAETSLLVKWRITSALNFCVQESMVRGREYFEANKAFYLEYFKPIINEICDAIIADIVGDQAHKKYDYYFFPLGILFEFDIAIGDDYTARSVLEKIFDDTKSDIEINLLKKFLLDISVLTANSFFNQFDYYKDKAYSVMETILTAIFPYDNNEPDRKTWNVTNVVLESLLDSLSLLSYINPQKTAEWLNNIMGRYNEDNENRSRLLQIASKIEIHKRECFKQLYHPMKNDKELTIMEYLNNVKNTWLFADFAINVLIGFPRVRAIFAEWVFKNMLKNINIYRKRPEKFFKHIMLQLFRYLNESSGKELGELQA